MCIVPEPRTTMRTSAAFVLCVSDWVNVVDVAHDVLLLSSMFWLPFQVVEYVFHLHGRQVIYFNLLRIYRGTDCDFRIVPVDTARVGAAPRAVQRAADAAKRSSNDVYTVPPDYSLVVARSIAESNRTLLVCASDAPFCSVGYAPYIFLRFDFAIMVAPF
jgi:hypothetical protein